MSRPLAELCDPNRSICYGIVQPGNDEPNGLPIVRVKDLSGNRIETKSVMRVSREIESKYKRSRVRHGDVLISLVGSMGQVAIASEEIDGWNIARAVGLIPAIDRHHAEWIKFALQSPEAQTFIRDHANTTVQATFNLKDLARIPIPYPSARQREEITAILGALDDMIEVNRKTAATLEEMARALYRSWFVDFDPVRARAEGRAPAHMDAATAALFPDSFGEDGMPEGWRQGTLNDLAILNPTSHSRKSHPSRVEYVDLANTKWGRIEDITDYEWDAAPSRARLSLRAGDTIVGTVRPGNGSYSYVGRDGLTGSTGFAVLRPKDSDDAALIYLAATDPSTIEDLANLADGGAYPAVRPDVVASRPINVAPDSILMAFSRLASLFISRIEAAKTESSSLARLRDTLLPRLMSGELRANAAYALIEEVA